MEPLLQQKFPLQPQHPCSLEPLELITLIAEWISNLLAPRFSKYFVYCWRNQRIPATQGTESAEVRLSPLLSPEHNPVCVQHLSSSSLCNILNYTNNADLVDIAKRSWEKPGKSLLSDLRFRSVTLFPTCSDLVTEKHILQRLLYVLSSLSNYMGKLSFFIKHTNAITIQWLQSTERLVIQKNFFIIIFKDYYYILYTSSFVSGETKDGTFSRTEDRDPNDTRQNADVRYPPLLRERS